MPCPCPADAYGITAGRDTRRPLWQAHTASRSSARRFFVCAPPGKCDRLSRSHTGAALGATAVATSRGSHHRSRRSPRSSSTRRMPEHASLAGRAPRAMRRRLCRRGRSRSRLRKIRVNDQYPADMPWETSVRLRTMRQDHAAESDRNKTRGVPRAGAALLHGLLSCGACGQKRMGQ